MGTIGSEVYVDFSHTVEGHGDVYVNAVFDIQKPDFYSKESDWDYNGFQECLSYEVFKDGKLIYVDIPEDVLYHYLRDYLRNIEISGCFSTETGGF